MNQHIQFNSGVFDYEMNGEEVKKLKEDCDFLLQAVLNIANPELCRGNFDFHMTPEEYKQQTKELFLENSALFNYSKEFIEKAFN